MTKKASDISRALLQKGFVEYGKRDHIFYFFCYERKKTQIYTKISHSAKDIDSKLVSAMARQVKLSNSQFGQLIDCQMDGPAYAETMIQQSHITPTPDPDPDPAKGNKKYSD